MSASAEQIRHPARRRTGYWKRPTSCPVIGLSKITFLAVVKSDGPLQSMGQLIAAAKAKPDSVSFSIPALGWKISAVR